MAELYTCRCCGASIEVSENGKTGECIYCGTKIVFPKAGFNRINQANAHRKRREFEQAEAIYRSLSIAFPEDPEIWWNILLCEYGIEYVEEGDRRVPTINRMKYDSIYAQKEYQTVLSLADAEMKTIYEEAAAEIEDLQKRLQEVIAKEKEYDVFISFKDKDDVTGERTDDSVLAQEIYDVLTKEGYRVFFSRVTLRKAIAQEFDPKIYAALSRAPMMILVGSSKEHINSTWVKSEWSRYLKMMETDSGKFILPVCMMMKPEDLPAKLRSMEAIEASGFGYIDRILDNVGARLGRKKEERVQKNIEKNIEVLEKDELKRITQLGFTALQNEEWKEAENYFEQALDISIEFADAWWGKLGVLTKNFTARMNLETNSYATNFMKEAMDRATEEEKQRYEQDLAKFRIKQQEYVCNDLLDAFHKKTNHMKKLWFEGTSAETEIISSVKNDQQKILQAAPDYMKEDLKQKFDIYNRKQVHVIELKQEYEKIEAENKILVDNVTEIAAKLSDAQKSKAEVRKEFPFGKVLIFEVFAIMGLALPISAGSIGAIVLAVVALLPLMFGILIVRKDKRIFARRIADHEMSLNNAKAAGKKRAVELDKIYGELKEKYKDVAEYILPEDWFAHVNESKRKLNSL